VRERGYVESPVRIESIRREIDRTGLFIPVAVRTFSEKHIRAVHEQQFVDYLKAVCARLNPDEAVYPYVFPIRNAARPPKERAVRAGYFCIDTFTPLTRNVWPAAKRAVDCALTAARHILEGHMLAYALVRPPGHHAERRVFGGFCYFGNAAVAAHYLSTFGKVAILDIDFHHGNGTQDIFYERSDVLTVSIHGHPRFAYPYFSGFEDEKGTGAGTGYNLNIPLSEQLDGNDYPKALARALRRIVRFKPQFLVVSLGLDTAQGDPTGTWNLLAKDFAENGRLIGRLRLPTLVVQEGGYDTRVLGSNARHFFTGLWAGMFER
jgi:acetoin utilization deacetylase AcuC-like enzyme